MMLRSSSKLVAVVYSPLLQVNSWLRPAAAHPVVAHDRTPLVGRDAFEVFAAGAAVVVVHAHLVADFVRTRHADAVTIVPAGRRIAVQRAGGGGAEGVDRGERAAVLVDEVDDAGAQLVGRARGVVDRAVGGHVHVQHRVLVGHRLPGAVHVFLGHAVERGGAAHDRRDIQVEHVRAARLALQAQHVFILVGADMARLAQRHRAVGGVGHPGQGDHGRAAVVAKIRVQVGHDLLDVHFSQPHLAGGVGGVFEGFAGVVLDQVAVHPLLVALDDEHRIGAVDGGAGD